MKPLWLIGVCLLCACAMAEDPKEQPKPVTIPLDQIWASNMPGTIDIRGLASEKFGRAVTNFSTHQQLRLLQ